MPLYQYNGSVTGGIGKASCELFAREGARVVVADVREDAASDVARGIRDAGHAAVHVSGDVSNADHARAMVEAAEREFGALHVLFNNAGVMLAGDDRPEDTDEEVITKTLNVNVKGVINGCKFGIPAMRRAGGGSIVNTASFVALMGAATPQIAYTASKGAVLALTREIAVIHARENIRANALCPGPLRTELLMKFLDTDDKRRRRLVHIPVGRFGEATEMARAALFLASDVDSSFMTGAALVVDGGITAAYVTPE
eukprot:jgi/Chlat1/271/Chrsp1S00215